MDLPGPSGVYMIIAGRRRAGHWNPGTFRLLDIGQAHDVYLRVAEHDREECRHGHGRGNSLLVKTAELKEDEYDEIDRRIVACCLRASERPPCGTECNDGYRRDVAVAIANLGDPVPLAETRSC